MGGLRYKRCTFCLPRTDDYDRFIHSPLFFLQLSKRSATELCGRNDGNLKVIFPDVEMEDATDSGLKVRAQPGDYVLVKVRCPFGLLACPVNGVLDWVIQGNEIFSWRNSLVK